MRKSRFFSGLAAFMGVLLTMGVMGQGIAADNAGFINTALGTATTRIVETGEAGDTEYYKSSFGSFDDPAAQEALLAASFEQNINEMREGAALLYNNGALPMTEEKRVSVFGHAAVELALQSNSAGTRVYGEEELNVVSLREALESEGFAVNPALFEAMSATETTRYNGPQGWGSGRGVSGYAAGTEEPGSFYEAQKESWASDYRDAAIVILARQGAEGIDLRMREYDDDGKTVISSLALHRNEREMLELVRSEFSKVIVLLNSPNQLEVHEILPYCDALLYIGLPGHQGFTGVAEILRGVVNPSGHLADTYAVNSLGAPAVINSGTETPKYANAEEIVAEIGPEENAQYLSFQAESIYLGYRYYETRYADCVTGEGNAKDPVGAVPGASAWEYDKEVVFPFGYGLSYTTFRQTLDQVDLTEDAITAVVTVENTGSLPGKSVVQLYAQTPYGDYEKENKVEKSAIQLLDFGKTKLLQPGEKETLRITADPYLLASYDYVGAKTYILSGGEYYLAIGDNAHDALNHILAAKGYEPSDGMTEEGDPGKVFSFTMELDTERYSLGEDGTPVTNRFEDCDLNYWVPGGGVYLSRSDWAGTFPREKTTVEADQAMRDILDGEWYEKPEDAPSYEEIASRFGVNVHLALAAIRDVHITDTETCETFIYQLQPEDLPNATAESFTCPLVGTLSPGFAVGDGIDSVGGFLPFPVTVNGTEVQVPTTRYCSKTILTGTFNRELYEGRGHMMGEDGLWSGFMINYSIGADLHRTPFGGRAFEYMSECPILSYLASIPETIAMEKTGSHAGPKHFCGNDQEFQREGVSVFFNEQAFREGSLRAFEGCIRVAEAGGLMQSYERLGLKWSSASYALNTIVLRQEWNWPGAVDTDAAPVFSGYVEDAGYKYHSPEVLAAGTQEWCLDGVGGHGNAVLAEAKETDDGYLLMLLRDAAISWEYAISRSAIVNGMAANVRIEKVTPWWEKAIQWEILGSAFLLCLFLAGLLLSRKGELQRPAAAAETAGKKRGAGAFLGLIAGVFGLAALAVSLPYSMQGGILSPVCTVSGVIGSLCALWLFLADHPLTDFQGILAAVCLTVSLMGMLKDGMGNIIDAVQGISLFGQAELASFNFLMAGLLGAGILLTVMACFGRKRKIF